MIIEILEPSLFGSDIESGIDLVKHSRTKNMLVVLIPSTVNTLVMIPTKFLHNYSPVDNIKFITNDVIWSHWGFHLDCFTIGQSYDKKIMWKCNRTIYPENNYHHRGVSVNNNRLDECRSRLYNLKKKVYNV